MRRWLIAGMLVVLGCCFPVDLSAAAYDLTGTWNYQLSDNWAEGGMNCYPGPAASGTCEIHQSGDTFSFAFTSGVVCSPPGSCTYEGTVHGAVYTCSTTEIVDDENGSVTSTIVFTASSATSAAGSGTSRYTHPSGLWECNWGNSMALTKSDSNAGSSYTLTMKTTGSGSADPAGGVYAPGTTVSLTATPDPDWQFFCWLGDVADPDTASTTVTMDCDQTVTALFVQQGRAVRGGPGDGAMLFLSEGAFEQDPTSIPPPAEAPGIFPFGLIGFSIGEVAEGGTVTVACSMPDNIPGEAVYYKYEDGQYTTYGNVSGLDDGDHRIVVTLTDGGAGDADGAANGLIVDPGGPALPSSIYFPHVASNIQWETEIAVINKSDQEVSGILKAYDREGTEISQKSLVLSGSGRRALTIGSEFSNPEDIRYMVFSGNSSKVCGYTKFYQEGLYRVAVPAVQKINTGDIYIPHIASNEKWWTGLALVNTTDVEKTIDINFNNGETKQVVMSAGRHMSFPIKSRFGGTPQPGIKSAIISGGSGVVGLELFGGATVLSGVLVKDDSADTLYFPHVASDNKWWTGIAAYNPSSANAGLTVTPYTENGSALDALSVDIPAGQKYLGSARELELPKNTAWFKLESSRPLNGFELFGTSNGNQLAGYSAVNINRQQGVFPKIEQEGWTGVAFVNISSSSAAITLSIYDDDGFKIAEENIALAAHEKVVDRPENIFGSSITDATYMKFSSNRDVVGFQLNSAAGGMMLDALPGM
jgi:hypothetical protein